MRVSGGGDPHRISRLCKRPNRQTGQSTLSKRRIAMNMRTTVLAALMGSTILAGAALAQGGSDMSLSTAAKDGDRVAVQTLLKGRSKQDIAGADGTAALVWAATRN